MVTGLSEKAEEGGPRLFHFDCQLIKDDLAGSAGLVVDGKQLVGITSQIVLTINVQLILIVQEVIFLCGQNRQFRGVFREGQDFFDP